MARCIGALTLYCCRWVRKYARSCRTRPQSLAMSFVGAGREDSSSPSAERSKCIFLPHESQIFHTVNETYLPFVFKSDPVSPPVSRVSLPSTHW